jgi:type IV pilus assembly protein PilY1
MATKAVSAGLFLIFSGGWSGVAFAAKADIADEPLAASNGAGIRPNLMFILDDSGSMDFGYLPDGANYPNACFGDKNFNRLAYDPARTYDPPVKPDGSAYPNSDFYDALRDGFGGDSDRDLSKLEELNTPWITYTNDDKQQVTTKFYYSIGGNNANCSINFHDPSKFKIITKISDIVAPAGVDARTNYANWYSYYRTRMLTMRTAAGRAFANINPTRFRVGFSTIHSTSVADGKGNGFLNIRDFDATGQKVDFFSLLYGSAPSGGTPLRSSLARAGRYYANKIKDQPVDPVQYSCQRNYAILSTDGYWNTDSENGSWNAKLDGGKIGNQDGTDASPPVSRPQLDSLNKSTTLADVAMYYYRTDLRTPDLGNCSVVRDGVTVQVCQNDVAPIKTIPEDPNDWQHMNTITLGLGVSGSLNYTSANYNLDTDKNSDFFKITNGTKVWPDPMDKEDGDRIDDLWHAAVNAGGIYYSARNPTELSAGLAKALNSIDANKGSGTAAATSNLRPVEGDRAVFIASYYSNYWDGDIKAQTIDPTTGVIESNVTWSARAQLATKTAANRKIYFYDTTEATNLRSFEYSNLPAGKKAAFDNLCPASGDPKLSQCLNLSDVQKAAITGGKVVSFLRGDRTNEAEPNSTSPLFRYRYNDTEKYHNVLGDIVNSIPVYVKKPGFRYVDSSYASFVKSMDKRKGVVYAGANDGMLHAFDASTGAELWAYVPSAVIPRLYKLADTNYATKHEYFVDGSPVVGDVKIGDEWRTILVGGLNAGGRAYYALDITNPDNPRALWEYTDTDLGLSFGNPVISQTKSGKWVVLFSSGFNNVDGGDGNGHLYVLDAATGANVAKLATYVGTGSPAGTSATPSNLGRINAWVDDETLNMTEQVYGGDMQGNVWRFDIGDSSSSNWAAVRLGSAVSGGLPQPITVKPELTEITSGAAKYRLVSVGTGRYLGKEDVESKQVQSVYVFKDTGSTSGLGVLRNDPKMVEQTMESFTAASTNVTARRIATSAAVNWGTASGWFIDFKLTGGERVDVEMQQQLTRLTVATNAPDPNACSLSGASGSSWLYIFDLMTGAPPSTAVDGAVGIRLGNTLTAGITTIQISNGNTKTIVVSRGGDTSTNDDPAVGASPSQLRRTSWRELMN